MFSSSASALVVYSAFRIVLSNCFWSDSFSFVSCLVAPSNQSIICSSCAVSDLRLLCLWSRLPDRPWSNLGSFPSLNLRFFPCGSLYVRFATTVLLCFILWFLISFALFRFLLLLSFHFWCSFWFRLLQSGAMIFCPFPSILFASRFSLIRVRHDFSSFFSSIQGSFFNLRFQFNSALLSNSSRLGSFSLRKVVFGFLFEKKISLFSFHAPLVVRLVLITCCI